MGGSAGGVVATGPLLLAAVLSAVSLSSCSRQSAPKPKWAQKPTPVSDTRPSAQVTQQKHDFGVVNPGASGSHDFEVRNTGTEALNLSGGPAEDAAIRCEALQPSIAPGEMGTVRVTWNTGLDGPPLFERQASVQTNDPLRKTITFTVSGTVRMLLAAEPGGIFFRELDPRHPSASATTLVFSQVWDAFSIADVTCSLAGATWTIEPADAAALQDCDAKCGYRVTVTTPMSLPGGPFRNLLGLRVSAPQADKAGSPTVDKLQLPITGRVLRRLALYGEGLEGGNLDLGRIRPGQGRRHRLLAKVRDPEPKVRVASLRTKPDFLKVHLQPLRSDDPECGLYEFVVEVPADAPPCIYRGLRPGEIHVRMDHPRLEDVDLKVYFAVCPER
jgi:hypothetical protein